MRRACLAVVVLALGACDDKATQHASCPDGFNVKWLDTGRVLMAACIRRDVQHGVTFTYRTSIDVQCQPEPKQLGEGPAISLDQKPGEWFESGGIPMLDERLRGKTCAGKPIEPLWTEFKAKLPIEVRETGVAPCAPNCR